MAHEPFQKIDRLVAPYDLTWLLELHRKSQLDLDPAYQRRSVWTTRDRKSFMDTIFRNYPSPAIFLHKTLDDITGSSTYHVVDGKQRITTILMFINNEFPLASDFGDVRFDGKKWRDLVDPAIRRLLWNYRVTIEELDDTGILNVNDVFARINRNARQLNRQELRHARFGGWFISFLENESQLGLWRTIKVQTLAKERRMMDIQNISELAAVVLRDKISGFNQDDLDDLYAKYEVVESDEAEFDPGTFLEKFSRVRSTLEAIEATSGVVSRKAQQFYNLYTLWTALYRHPLSSEQVGSFAARYEAFMDAVAGDDSLEDDRMKELAQAYASGTLGASTDLAPRQVRQDALEAALFQDSAATADED